MGAFLSKDVSSPALTFRGPVELVLKPLPFRCNSFVTKRRALVCRYVARRVSEKVTPGVRGIIGYDVPPMYRIVHKMVYEVESEVDFLEEGIHELKSKKAPVTPCMDTERSPALAELVNAYIEEKSHRPLFERWLFLFISSEGNLLRGGPRIDLDPVVVLERTMRCKCSAYETHYKPKYG